MLVPGLLSQATNVWLETQYKFPSHNPRGLEAEMSPTGLEVSVSQPILLQALKGDGFCFWPH